MWPPMSVLWPVLRPAMITGGGFGLASLVLSALLAEALEAQHALFTSGVTGRGGPMTLFTLLWGLGGYTTPRLVERFAGLRGPLLWLGAFVGLASCLIVDGLALTTGTVDSAAFVGRRIVFAGIWSIVATITVAKE